MNAFDKALETSTRADQLDILRAMARKLGMTLTEAAPAPSTTSDDPRARMHALTEAELARATAAGQTLSYVDAMARVRAKPEHAKLDQALSDYYQSGADANIAGFTLRDR